MKNERKRKRKKKKKKEKTDHARTGANASKERKLKEPRGRLLRRTRKCNTFPYPSSLLSTASTRVLSRTVTHRVAPVTLGEELGEETEEEIRNETTTGKKKHDGRKEGSI